MQVGGVPACPRVTLNHPGSPSDRARKGARRPTAVANGPLRCRRGDTSVMSAPSPAPPGSGSSEARSLQQTAASIRFNLDWQWTAIKLQHDRLADNVILTMVW